MRCDYTISDSENLKKECFHLSCGFYETTTFLFHKAKIYVDIHYNGKFTFYSMDAKKLHTLTAKPMDTGRGCYMDVLITTTEDSILFQLPEYEWIDHYPHCDGESDRWDTKIIGIRDEVKYPF